MEYLVRACKEDDIPAVVTLCAKHAEYEGAAYSPEGKAAGLRALLFGDHPVLFCLVVEWGNDVVGYATYTFDYSTWSAARFLYMDCLFLEPAFRGLGIGEAVMKQLVDISRTNDCVNIQWQTPDFNERAIAFYKRIGATGKNKVRFYIDTQ